MDDTVPTVAKAVAETAELLDYDMDAHPNRFIMSAQDSPKMKLADRHISTTIRNIHMKNGCDQLAQDVDDARVILYFVGGAHIAGCSTWLPEYTGSLSDLYETTGQPYVAFPITSSAAEQAVIYPDTVGNDNIHGLYVPTNPSMGSKAYGRNEMFQQAEIRHIMAVALQGPLEKFFKEAQGRPVDRIPNLQKSLTAEFQATVRELITENIVRRAPQGIILVIPKPYEPE